MGESPISSNLLTLRSILILFSFMFPFTKKLAAILRKNYALQQGKDASDLTMPHMGILRDL